MCMYACIYIHMYVCLYMYMRMCMDVYICVCVCACVCVYIYMYMHVCIYIYMYLYITCMCSLFHLALRNEDGGVQLVYESACCLAWGAIFDRRKDSGVVCVFSYFNVGGSVCVCECVYTHAHTHTAQVLGCEPRSRDQTPGGPEESRWTKSWHTHIRICVQSTHVYICVQRRDEILD